MDKFMPMRHEVVAVVGTADQQAKAKNLFENFASLLRANGFESARFEMTEYHASDETRRD